MRKLAVNNLERKEPERNPPWKWVESEEQMFHGKATRRRLRTAPSSGKSSRETRRQWHIARYYFRWISATLKYTYSLLIFIILNSKLKVKLNVAILSKNSKSDAKRVRSFIEVLNHGCRPPHFRHSLAFDSSRSLAQKSPTGAVHSSRYSDTLLILSLVLRLITLCPLTFDIGWKKHHWCCGAIGC